MLIDRHICCHPWVILIIDVILNLLVNASSFCHWNNDNKAYSIYVFTTKDKSLTSSDGNATMPGAPWSEKYTNTWSFGPLKRNRTNNIHSHMWPTPIKPAVSRQSTCWDTGKQIHMSKISRKQRNVHWLFVGETFSEYDE